MASLLDALIGNVERCVDARSSTHLDAYVSDAVSSASASGNDQLDAIIAQAALHTPEGTP